MSRFAAAPSDTMNSASSSDGVVLLLRCAPTSADLALSSAAFASANALLSAARCATPATPSFAIRATSACAALTFDLTSAGTSSPCCPQCPSRIAFSVRCALPSDTCE